MDPNLENSIAEISANNNANEPAPATPITPASKSKTNKALVWCLSILVVISLAAAGVFTYLYFSNTNTQNQSQSGGTETGSDSIVDTSDEEVEITDADIIQDLDEKISMLLYNDATTKSFNSGIGNIAYYDFELFRNGSYTEPVKAGLVVNSITSEPLSSEEVESIIIFEDATDMSESLRTKGYSGIRGEKVREKYQDVFGEELSVGAEAQSVCGYKYNSEYDFYYFSPYAGCGGTNPFIRYYYKNKYTTSSDYAYVYISTALYNAEDGNVYCDILAIDESFQIISSDVCDSVATDEEFTLDESNYEDYANYRFVFKKAEDGTYYFVKVEKV